MYATTGKGAFDCLTLYFYTLAANASVFSLCAVLRIHASTHYHSHSSSFITPQPAPPASPSPHNVRLLVETAAICSALKPALLPSWMWGEKGGIHQNCADSALSVAAFFIIHRTTLPSCLKRQLNVWRLQGVWGRDNVQWVICPPLCLSLSLSL